MASAFFNSEDDTRTDDHVPGYILCGGKSHRFGRDKARQQWGEQTLIQFLASQLGLWADDVIAVADRHDKYEDLGIPAIADLRPNCGPLGGIETALRHARQEKDTMVAIISCDLTMLNPGWLDYLEAQLSGNPSVYCAFYSESGVDQGKDVEGKAESRWHPFPGLYRTDLLPAVEQQLDAGNLACQKFLRQLGKRAMPVATPGDWPQITQINTPEDLKSWQREVRKRP